jgi:AhpD family alkylhydroperoxidase
MEKNYVELTKRISGDLRTLRKDIPDTMQAFSALAQAATRDGALDRKTKELIAIGIATRCDGCIGFHTEALVKLGATRQEVEETLGMAVYMGGGPSLMYAADASLRLNSLRSRSALRPDLTMETDWKSGSRYLQDRLVAALAMEPASSLTCQSVVGSCRIVNSIWPLGSCRQFSTIEV